MPEIYALTGQEALSHAEMAAKLSEALGRTIVFVDVPPEVMREALFRTPMPAWQADGLIEDYAHCRSGEAALVAAGVQDATGAAPRSFAAFAATFT